MVNFGVAGYPPAFFQSKYKKNRASIFEWLHDLKLTSFEAQMTYGPRTKKETCIEYNNLAKEFNVDISIHASYFIVLTCFEKDKIARSIDTLQRTFELSDLMGSNKIILHPGPFYKHSSEDCKKRLIDNLSQFFLTIGKSDIGLYLETAGKRGQYGSIEEIFAVVDNVEGCYPCVDFGHVHARTGGTLGNPEGINNLFSQLDQLNAFKSGNKIHFHYTPIHYGPKGEISHKALADIKETNSQMNLSFFKDTQSADDLIYHPRFEKIIDNLSNVDMDFTVVSEANNSQEIAAMAMSQYYYSKEINYV